MPIYYEFEVSLRELRPFIRRRFVLQKSANFLDLHEAIQAAFGWTNSHLYDFRTPNKKKWGTIARTSGADADDQGPDARTVPLEHYFKGSPGERCVYVYDFGDDWRHEVWLIREYASDENFTRRLLDGEYACPPENCGGARGFNDILNLLPPPSDPDTDDPHEDLREWVGRWKLNRFDLKKVQQKFNR